MLRLSGFAIGFLLAAPHPSQSAAEVREAARECLRDARCQTVLPGAKAPRFEHHAGSETEIDGRDSGRRPSGREGETWPESGRRARAMRGGGDPWSFGALAGVARFLLWGLVVAIVLVAVIWLGRQISGWTRDQVVPAKTPPVLSKNVAPQDNLPDPESLAREGRWAEAVHALWLQALSALGQRLGRRFPDAATGREILGSMAQDLSARKDLETLMRRAESGTFGSAAMGRGDYEHGLGCLQRWRAA